MRYPTRTLLVLHRDDEFRTRVIRAAGTHFVCWSVSDWGMLRSAMRDAPPSAVVVVDPYLGSGKREIAPDLDVFLREYPWASVIAVVRAGRGSEESLPALVKRGISEVILQGIEDTPPAIRRTLRQAQGRFLKELLRRALPPHVSGRARIILMAAAEAISGGGHTPDLARALSVSTKTLARWCERAHLPPPRRLLAWLRVLLASELLDDPDRTVSSVARACGYTSDTALRRALLDFLEAGPTQLREGEAFTTASRAFVRELLERREEGRERRRLSRRASRAPG